MPLKQVDLPKHTRTERYEVTYEYTGAELEEVRRLTRAGEIVPDTVRLVWVRESSGPWRRLSLGAHGSYAAGFLKVGADEPDRRQRRSREIFDRGLGEIRPWATYLPHLRNIVDETEDNLPG